MHTVITGPPTNAFPGLRFQQNIQSSKENEEKGRREIFCKNMQGYIGQEFISFADGSDEEFNDLDLDCDEDIPSLDIMVLQENICYQLP